MDGTFDTYGRRVVDAELDELLPHLPAIALDGPRGVGKTSTALRRAGTVYRLDVEEERLLLAADPGRLDSAAPPVVIDEWQRLPEVWDRVRRSVDAHRGGGRFLLTGSAAPVEAPVHSGAGRIVSLRMRPLALAERGVGPAAVSLRQLLAGTRPVIDGDTDVDLPRYVDEILASGLPGLRTLPPRARRAALGGYLDAVVQQDVPEQGLLVRRPETLRAWLTAYGAATATITSYSHILEAATPGLADKPARSTVTQYRDVLTQLWLLDPVPGWLPSGTALGRLANAPKHHLADPALAAHLLGATEASLLDRGSAPGDVAGVARDQPLLGALFESLVALSVRVYAQAAEARVGHLRTRNGDHEIDVIVEGPDRRVVAFEVKLARTVGDADVKHLRWLAERLGDGLADAVIVTTGSHAYRRPDGIAVVPAALLGP
ncbi:MAG: DUF4143 domain-containing protein [Kineosporiaceae bacterium]